MEVTAVAQISDKIVLIGGGGLASNYLAVLKRCGLIDEVAGYLDDAGNQERMARWGLKHLGTIRGAQLSQSRVLVALGGPALAFRVFAESIDTNCVGETVIDPSSNISHGVEFGEGCVVMPGTSIQPFARLGAFTYVSTNSSIGHDVEIGRFSRISPSSISGDCKVGDCVLIGTGATVLPGLTIGDGAIVGAGAVVTKDVSPHTTVVGNPARVLGSKEP